MHAAAPLLRTIARSITTSSQARQCATMLPRRFLSEHVQGPPVTVLASKLGSWQSILGNASLELTESMPHIIYGPDMYPRVVLVVSPWQLWLECLYSFGYSMCGCLCVLAWHVVLHMEHFAGIYALYDCQDACVQAWNLQICEHSRRQPPLSSRGDCLNGSCFGDSIRVSSLPAHISSRSYWTVVRHSPMLRWLLVPSDRYPKPLPFLSIVAVNPVEAPGLCLGSGLWTSAVVFRVWQFCFGSCGCRGTSNLRQKH